MGSCGTICFGIVAVLVCGLGYFLYTPLPDYLDHPWEIQKVLAQAKIGGIIAELGHRTGFGDRMDLRRKWTYKWALLAPVQSNYLEGVKIKDTTFNGVPGRIYRPLSADESAPLPALVYYHGGGWVLLDVETYDPLMAEICRQANIVVISVEYRLAPEHPFPSSFDDCVTATKHVLTNGASYGVNPHKVAIGGDSAGGNLAAAVAHHFRNQRIEPRIKAHLSIYASLQVCSHALPMTKEREQFDESELMSYLDMISLWLNLNKQQTALLKSGKYVTPELAEKCKRLVNIDLIPANLIPKGFTHDVQVATKIDDDVIAMSKLIEDTRVSPLLEEDLSELPPTYVFTVQWDFVGDHGIIYANRLEKAGNKVVWHHGANMCHGVLNLCYIDSLCPPIIGNITEFLKKSFEQ